MFSFYGIHAEHEIGGKEPLWHFDTTTQEDRIIRASLALLSTTYQGLPVVTDIIVDKKSRIESAIAAMRRMFVKYEKHLASMTPHERDECEARMCAELIEELN